MLFAIIFSKSVSSSAPPGLELRSSGEAGESSGPGDKMGTYQLLPGFEEGDMQSPVYRQRHDGGGQQYHLYRCEML